MDWKADAETVQQRRAICRACPHAVGPTAAMKVFCERCNYCVLAVKVRLASESCPAGKWSTSTGTGATA